MAQLTPRDQGRRGALERLLGQTAPPSDWAHARNPKDDFLFKLSPTASERANNFERYITGYPWIYKAKSPEGDLCFYCALCNGKRADAGHLLSQDHADRSIGLQYYVDPRLPRWFSAWNAPRTTSRTHILFEHSDTLWPIQHPRSCSTCRAPVLIQGNLLCLSCQTRQLAEAKHSIAVEDDKRPCDRKDGGRDSKEAVIARLLERDEAPSSWSKRVNPLNLFTFKTDPTEQERKNNYALYVSGYPWIFRAPDPHGELVLFCALCGGRQANIGHLLSEEHDMRATMQTKFVKGRSGARFPNWFLAWGAPSIVTEEHTLFGWSDELHVSQTDELCSSCSSTLTIYGQTRCVTCQLRRPERGHGAIRASDMGQGGRRQRDEGGPCHSASSSCPPLVLLQRQDVPPRVMLHASTPRTTGPSRHRTALASSWSQRLTTAT